MPTLSTSDASIPTQAASTSAWERGGSIPWERDLLTLFVRNQIRVVLALPLLAVLYASVSLLWTTPLQSAAWLLTACGCQAIQYFLCKQYLDNADARGSQTEWVGMLTASEFLVAAAWSLPLFLFWDTGTHLQHLYLVATVMAVIAVRIMIAANFMPIIIAGTGFMTFNVAIRCILEADPLYVALGAMAIGLEIFFIQVAMRLQATARDMLIFKAHNEQLMVELKREKEHAEEERQKAVEASEAKSQFLAAMSHELRTPLNAIMGFSDILRQEMFGPHGVEAYKAYAGDIHSSGRYLLALINDILDLSRVEAGRRELFEEPLVLAESISEAVRMMRGRLEEKKLEIEIDVERSLPKLLADRRALHQVWLNLLSNAIKFSPPGARISIATERTDEGLLVRVRDNGPGIPPDEVETAMTAFARGSFAIAQAIDGAGLGLPIVRGLMGIHGGSFELKPRDAGGGTDAIVYFPSKRVLDGPRGEVLSEPTASDGQRRLMAITR